MSGYSTAATIIADAMHQAYENGTNLDEMFAVLSVQKEITSVHLAQAAIHQQAMLQQQVTQQRASQQPTEDEEPVVDCGAMDPIVPEVYQDAN